MIFCYLIAGILSQELDPGEIVGTYTSYIGGSYVQWVEAGGARVAPVIIGREREYYVEVRILVQQKIPGQMFKGLNGLLLPGGSAPLVGPGGYAEVGEIFFNLAVNVSYACVQYLIIQLFIQATKSGDHFPIWGTCNGFELLTVLASKDQSHLTQCTSQNIANPLHLLPAWNNSGIYGTVSIGLSSNV